MFLYKIYVKHLFRKGFFSRFSRSSVVDKAPIIEKKDSEENEDKDTSVDTDKVAEDSTTAANDSKDKGIVVIMDRQIHI